LAAEPNNVYASATDFEELIASNQDLSLPNPISGDKNSNPCSEQKLPQIEHALDQIPTKAFASYDRLPLALRY
jgi:hypothetical protein